MSRSSASVSVFDFLGGIGSDSEDSLWESRFWNYRRTTNGLVTTTCGGAARACAHRGQLLPSGKVQAVDASCFSINPRRLQPGPTTRNRDGPRVLTSLS